MSTDIVLDPNTHDVDLSTGFAQLFSEDVPATAQRIKQALLLRRGEWFVNTQIGVPYQQDFFQSKNSQSLIDDFLRAYILQVENVSRILDYSSTIGNDRALTVNFSVLTETGETIPNLIFEA